VNETRDLFLMTSCEFITSRDLDFHEIWREAL